MGCNNDKIRSFLTKPNSRMRKKFNDLQDAEKERDSSFAGRTVFNARVIGSPRATQAAVNNSSGTEAAQYNFIVQVRVFDVDNMIPDPIQSNTASSAATVINMHSDALVPSTLSGLITGDIVVIEFMEPYNQNTKQTPRIRSKVRSDPDYGEKIRTNFDNSQAGMQSFFDSGIPTTVGDTSGFQPKRRPYLLSPNTIIENGSVPSARLDFVQVNGYNVVSKGTQVKDADGNIILEYYSSDTQGGLAFIKGPNGENYANKLIELSNAYRAAALAAGDWANEWIVITSAYRSFAKQKQLYNDLGSTRAAEPGTSNHGWGLAFDFNHGATRDPTFEDKEYLWMNANASQYGFYNAGRGFNEPWHFEVLKDSRKGIYGSDIN